MPIWVQAEPLRPALVALSAESVPSTVCAHCPAAMWFVTAVPTGGNKLSARLTCYCRPMSANTWSSNEKNQLTDCDELRMQLLQRELDTQDSTEASSASGLSTRSLQQ